MTVAISKSYREKWKTTSKIKSTENEERKRKNRGRTRLCREREKLKLANEEKKADSEQEIKEEKNATIADAPREQDDETVLKYLRKER